MIVSHSKRFIFLKPRKVAGTSVEVALGRHYEEGDIFTPVGDYDPRWDGEPYLHPGRKWKGFRRHSTIARARQVLDDDTWKGYFKFSVVRNPWDLVVSQYHWALRTQDPEHTLLDRLARFRQHPKRVKRNLLGLANALTQRFLSVDRIPFHVFATYLLGYYESNDRFYFGSDGSLALDHVLRYESLDQDFQALCERLGLPETPLPSLKTKARPKGRDYTAYYDEKTRACVARAYRRNIRTFGYSFD